MTSRRAAAACLLALLVCVLPSGRVFALKVERLRRASAASGRNIDQEVAAGTAIVRFKAGVSTAAAAAALQPAGFLVVKYFPRFDFSLVRLPGGLGVEDGLLRLKSFPVVDSAAPDRVFRAKLAPDDPYVARQYSLAQVQAFGAWEYETGASSRVTVAVIDTGIDSGHSELTGKMVGTSRYFTPTSASVASDDQPPTPACNHATRVAGVAAAASDNSAGVAGMSWGARLLSLRVFDTADCSGDCEQSTCGTTEDAIAAAIDDVIPKQNSPAYGKIIVNMSLGSSGGCSYDTLHPLRTVVNSAVKAGLMLFAAAGNEGAGYMDSPANCPGVIAVGATDDQDKLAYFSNTDPQMAVSGLTAPGVDIYTTDEGGGYAAASGTSFSSPMAAGLAALLWSAKPDKPASAIWDYMRNSADDLGPAGPDSDFGWGRINAMKALRLAETGTTMFAGTKKAVAYPNPFRPKSQRLVTFSVPAEILASGVEVKVYTSEGELVKKLDGLAWDGKNEAGAAVASGVYLFKVKTDKDHAAGKLALIR